MTKELEEQFRYVGTQSDDKNPLVIAKFFNAGGAGTWYATEYKKKDKIFFGYVSIFGDHNDEWGSFSLAELESFKGNFGLGIEQDRYWEPKRFDELNL